MKFSILFQLFYIILISDCLRLDLRFLSISFRAKRQYTSLLSSKVDVSQEFNKFYSNSLDEIETPKKLKVEGKIPDFLSGGIFIKNGPACFGDLIENNKGYKYNHIFDGLAKLSKYEFIRNENNEINVLYSTKFLRSKLHSEIIEKKKHLPLHISVGPILPKLNSFLEKFKMLIGDNDNTNVNIARIGKNGPWACTTDGPVCYLHYYDNLTA